MTKRYITEAVAKDLGQKAVLIAGPRQVGKTTLACNLVKNFEYINYDVPSQRLTLLEQSWRRDVDLVVFDELHKMPSWKNWLKGVIDGEKLKPAIVVTGSARLDIARKMGDSLAGRYFLFHLHPLDLKELGDKESSKTSMKRLMEVGGFPEPFFSDDEAFPGRWRKSHVDIILRQDLLDLEQVRQITQLETLLEMLRDRVGSPISSHNIAGDLHVDDTTVRRWLKILENLFIVFKLTPWNRNIARSLVKAPKYYFFDNGLVRGDIGAQFENLVACALLKEVHFQRDVGGRELALHYLRNRNKNEIDFAVVEKGVLTKMIETKWADDEISHSFEKLTPKKSAPIEKIQLVGQGARERDLPTGEKIRDASSYLCSLKI